MKRFLIVFMVLAPFFMFASIGDNGISVDSEGNQLKWEEGNWDFFIMHKSLVEQSSENLTGSTDTNPQADTCIDPNIGSTYRLTSKHIPPDTDIDRAFLVWFSTQDPDNLNGKTDNSVTLTFTNSADPSITLTQEITASIHGNLATTQTGDFEYEALNIPDSINGNTGVYTYRVDVTDFMKEIISTGTTNGMNSGEALYGNYTVKGMDCSNHQTYLQTSGLVGGWFMPFVYTSSHINAKKIYFYNGLSVFHDMPTNTIKVSGFDLPDEAFIKLGLVVFDGDIGLQNAGLLNTEGLQISGQSNPDDFVPLYNDCNPQATEGSKFTEVYNSISSVFGWESNNKYWCIGDPNNPKSNENPIEYAIDADIFVVDSKKSPFDTMFNKGDSKFNIKITTNQDQIYTNLLVVSVDTVSQDNSNTETDTSDTADTTDTADSSDSADSSDTANTNTGDDSDTADTTDTGDDKIDTEADTDSESGNSENANPGMGELYGECRSDRTCNAGLVCNSHNICKEEIKFTGCSALVF